MVTVERSAMRLTDAQGKVLREPRNNSDTPVSFRWWLLDGKQMAESIAGTILSIENNQSDRLSHLTEMTRLYGSPSIYNNIGSAFSRARSVNATNSHRASYNLCESIIDTLESKFAKNKVIPTYITNGGDWDIQRKAKQLTKFTQGLFYQHNIHKKSITAWGDSAVWGDGFLYIYENDDEVCIERAFPHEIYVDVVESLNSEPKQLHRVKIVDRDIALEMFPELEESIRLASPANYQDLGGQSTVVDLVKVIGSWHLPSGKDSDDGVYAITIGDGAIKYEWNKNYFPFAHVRYSKRKLGWYGQGACERLENIQYELNRSMLIKQRSLWMQSSFKILCEIGSKIVSQHLTNDIGAIINYSGTPPQYVTPPATNPELGEWIDKLINYGYTQEGVSRLSSQGEVPLGVESGKAMRTLNQIEDSRFIFMQQGIEDFNLEIARQAIEVVRDIYARKGKYEVVFPLNNFLETVDWKDINLSEDAYILKAYPTSSLSEDITGRLSEVQELAQAGMISPRTARRLMNMPDIEMNDSLSNAAEDLLHKILEEMLFTGTYRAPEPFFDLQLAKQLVNEYYNYADYMNAPNDKLALLQRFNNQINELIAIATPAQPMQPTEPVPVQAVPQLSGVPAENPNTNALGAA